MIESFADFFTDLVKNVRFVDLIDVIIVSFFLYVFLNWFRKSASRRLLLSVVTFVIIYLVARIFGLYLTEMLIRILIIVIFLAAVIVFQSDIRKMVDLIGAWGSFHRKKYPNINIKTTDILTEAAAKMAERRTGALIALKGRDPWDSFINGGIELGGSVSQPILYSIFNTKSPGHDGAVMIEKDQIARFGTHLSLSVNLKEVGVGGTRHAAALGLSEQCDALVIAVSEERGTISVAEAGKLTVLSSSSQLKERLDEFWNRYYVQQSDTSFTWWKKSNFQTAVVSLLLAVTFWALFAYQSDKVYRTFTVPIEFRNLRSDLAMEDPVPMEGRVTLSGSEQAFRIFNPSNLVISIDMGRLEKGENEIFVAKDNLELPSGINLYRVEPRILKIKADEMKLIRVPVRVQTLGRLENHMKLLNLTPEPSTVILRVPESMGNTPKWISTEPIDLSGVNSSTSIYSRLIPPRHIRLLPDQNPEVLVKVNLGGQ